MAAGKGYVGIEDFVRQVEENARFDVQTEALGRLRCSSFRVMEIENFRDPPSNPHEFAIELLTRVAKRITPDGEEVPVSRAEAQQLTSTEIDNFARQMIQKHYDAEAKVEGESDLEHMRRVVTDSLEKVRSDLAAIAGRGWFSSLPIGKDPALATALKRNQQLADDLSRMVPSVVADSPERRLRELRMPEMPPNPAYETNEQLREMIRRQVAATRLIQSMNETTIAFLRAFEREARATSWHTRAIIAVAVLTLLVAATGTWWNITTSKQMTDANREMLERWATARSDLAVQSAREQEAQNRLIEELMAATQSLREQQRTEQRTAIEALREVFEERTTQDISAGKEP